MKDVQVLDGITNVLKVGKDYPVKVLVDLNGLSSDEVGLEMVITENGNDQQPKLIDKKEFTVQGFENNLCTYVLDMHLDYSGTYTYGMRLFPKNENLPHVQEFKYIKWI